METITSTQNPKIKELLKLDKAGKRRESGLFIIEGFRETDRAIRNGYHAEKIFYCPEIALPKHKLFLDGMETMKIPVNKHVFARIAYRDNHDGLITVARIKDHSISNFSPGNDSLYLVLEEVEKPGNLGAILRTADAAGVDAVFVCDAQTDIYNPNAIRASLGTVFSNKIVCCDSSQALDLLKKHHVRIFSAALQNSKEYYEADFRNPCALVFGSEAKGLSNLWRDGSDEILRIPMQGIADSLNVSVSAAVFCFEAVRQKRNK